MGGIYNTAHGLANAVIMPIVLEDYGTAVHPQLAHLAEITGVKTTGSDAEKANALYCCDPSDEQGDGASHGL